MMVGFFPYLVFLICFVLLLIYGFLVAPLNLSGKGAAVLFVIMLIALIFIAPAYAVSDNYTKECLTEDWFSKLLLVVSVIADVFAIPFLCCLMYKKVKKNHDEKRKEQLLLWIKCLNEYYMKEIRGFNKIIDLIQANYANEKNLENLLCLFGFCGAEGLVCKFKEVTHDQEILVAVNEICKEHDIENDFSSLTIGQLFMAVKEEKSKCYRCIYNENEIEKYDYQLVKEKYHKYCK